jgi:hypothetical protein
LYVDSNKTSLPECQTLLPVLPVTSPGEDTPIIQVNLQLCYSGERIVDKLLKRNSNNRQKLGKAWDKSILTQNTITERGGYVFADLNDLNILVVRLAPKSSSIICLRNSTTIPSIDLSHPPKLNDLILVANFHTHPLEENSEPSDADLRNAMRRGVPGIVFSQRGVYIYGPVRRSNMNRPLWCYPNDGPVNFDVRDRSSVKRVTFTNPFRHPEPCLVVLILLLMQRLCARN